MWKQLSITLLVAGLSAVSVFAQDPTLVPTENSGAQSPNSVVGGDENLLRGFITRYLLGGNPNGGVTVMIGSADSNLPFTLEAPEGAILYGTVARDGTPPSGGTFYEIVYDVSQTPGEIVDFYKQAYSGADWVLTSENVSPSAGFTGQSNSYASFCYQGGAATLNINAFNTGTGPTSMNITAQVPGDAYVCANPNQQGPSDPLYALIPSLALPEGVSIISNMGGGLAYYTPNGRSNNVSAILETSRPLSEIANDYNAQLSAQGWQQISAETSERTAFSTWTLTDETGKAWHGSLLIVADNTANRYNAVIYVEE